MLDAIPSLTDAMRSLPGLLLAAALFAWLTQRVKERWPGAFRGWGQVLSLVLAVVAYLVGWWFDGAAEASLREYLAYAFAAAGIGSGGHRTLEAIRERRD